MEDNDSHHYPLHDVVDRNGSLKKARRVTTGENNPPIALVLLTEEKDEIYSFLAGDAVRRRSKGLETFSVW